MAKRKSIRRKRNGKFLWLIAGIMAAITFGMAVYMLILAKKGSAYVVGKVKEVLESWFSGNK